MVSLTIDSIDLATICFYQVCADLGGYLASINSLEEDNKVG